MKASNHVETHRALKGAIAILLLIGLLSSLYLTNLYLNVHNTYGKPVDSFCALNDEVNCVTVANSRWSTLAGIPIALYGIEFFTVLLIIVWISVFRPIRWESHVFLALALAIPFCLLLAYISSFIIHSICILCCTVYAACFLGALLISITFRRDLSGLARHGPREILSTMKRSNTVLVLVTVTALAAMSQFVWVPDLFCSAPCEGEDFFSEKSAYLGMPEVGLVLGPADAPLKIEEFTDMQCPFCGKAHQVIIELIRRHPGKIRHEHHDFPLDHNCNPNIHRPFHPNACTAARFGRCAARQNKFRVLSEFMFQNRNRLTEEDILTYANGVKELDIERLKACVLEPGTLKDIQEDIAEGQKRNMRGTPTFFVNGQAIVGYKPIEFWEEVLREANEKAK